VSSVCARLAAFMRSQLADGVPAHARHEANRLLLNQLKASVGATTHPAVAILNGWAAGQQNTDATVLWLGTRTSGEHAAMVNAALFEVLDFNETYIPTFQHAVSGVLPAVLAVAEYNGSTGREVLDALALGIEVELACAAILMPTGYFRGFIPGGITGAIGGAAACAILQGLDDAQMRHALGLAMNSGMGCYQSAGSSALPYVMATTARNGMVACELGETWRIMGQSYKTVPTETITHGPIECTLTLLARAQGRIPQRMRFGVSPMVVQIADERASRWGVPSTDLEARFDLRHCAAAAWQRGRFTLAEMMPPAFTDPAIIDLRSRIDLVADPAQTNFEGATLDIVYSDGSADSIVIRAFRGTPNNPMTDQELSDLFCQAAELSLTAAQIDTVIEANWALDSANSIHALIAACTPKETTP
jgi:2-methylcitrate dehydratase PrpD